MMLMEQPSVRIATRHDSHAILGINSYWVGRFVDGDLGGGFHRNALSGAEVDSICREESVVVAEIEGRVVGYYLANGSVLNKVVHERQLMLDGLLEQGRLPRARYVLQTQAGVAAGFQRMGVGAKMLNHLRVTMVDRADYLLGVIYRGNDVGLAANVRSGWRLVAEVDAGWLAVVPTRSERL